MRMMHAALALLAIGGGAAAQEAQAQGRTEDQATCEALLDTNDLTVTIAH